jgi:segregation and condensation protein B
MDYFGINSSDDLPKIREVLAEQLIAPTYVQDEVITKSPACESQED